MGIGEQPASGSLSIWRSRLPPQSFLPVGIGEATPLVTSFDFLRLRLPPQSFLPVGIREVMSLMTYTGDALGV